MGDKFVFIDRDGVINKDGDGWTEHGYVTCWEDFNIFPGVSDAIKKLTEAGYKNIIISNQQCVGKGYLTVDELDDMMKKMSKLFAADGGKITATYFCVHLKEENCMCRKPKSGLFRKAQEDLGIDKLDGQYFIGDSESDIQAGKAAGLSTILVLSGKSSSNDVESWKYKPDNICENLLEAANFIVEKG